MHGKAAGGNLGVTNMFIILTIVMMWVSLYSYLLSCIYMFNVHY